MVLIISTVDDQLHLVMECKVVSVVATDVEKLQSIKYFFVAIRLHHLQLPVISSKQLRQFYCIFRTPCIMRLFSVFTLLPFFNCWSFLVLL